MKKALLVMTAIAASSSMAFAANPVTVGASGDYATISLAIASFSSTGANAGETPPLVINIDPTATYDEALDLNDGNVGTGDIVGDLVIQSATPGTLVPVALQMAGTNDAIELHQSTASVTFKDLLIYPSLTNPFTDEFFKLDKNTSADDAVEVTHSIINCVVTEIDAGGVPLVTDKLSCLAAPPATVGSGRSGFAYYAQVWGEPGEAISLNIDNSGLYGNIASIGLRLVSDAVTDTFTVNNSIVAATGNASIRIGSGSQVVTVALTGTDQTAGPDSATVLALPGGDNHCIWLSGSQAGSTLNIDGVIMVDGAGGISRGLSGSASVDVTIANTIITTPGPNIVDGPENASTYSNVTFHSLEDTNALFLVAGVGSIAMNDVIFSGVGTKLAGATPTGGLSVDYAAFVESGANAITARDDGSITVTYGSNIINDDPLYASFDATSADFMDVTAAAYAAAGTAGAPLAGGANFAAAVRDWMTY